MDRTELPPGRWCRPPQPQQPGDRARPAGGTWASSIVRITSRWPRPACRAFSVASVQNWATSPKITPSRLPSEFNDKAYHSPQDEVQAPTGISSGLRYPGPLRPRPGPRRCPARERLPTWNPGDEFLPTREKSGREAGAKPSAMEAALPRGERRGVSPLVTLFRKNGSFFHSAGRSGGELSALSEVVSYRG